MTSGRTLAFADFDADGFMDVYEQNYYGEPGQLYRNQGRADGNPNHWLASASSEPGPALSAPSSTAVIVTASVRA